MDNIIYFNSGETVILVIFCNFFIIDDTFVNSERLRTTLEKKFQTVDTLRLFDSFLKILHFHHMLSGLRFSFLSFVGVYNWKFLFQPYSGRAANFVLYN